ncbi:MAG: hypothetical protein H6648_05195 [Caldilineae bacterium]|nr:hypothetical protein [Caldilineae bacterium]
MSRHPSGRHRRAEAVAPDPIARASRQGRLAPLAPLAPLALLTWLALALAMSGAIATTRAPLRAQAQPWVLMGHDNLRSEILRLDTRTGAASVVGATGWSSRGSGMDMAPARLETVTGRLEAGALMGLIFDTAISADYLSRVDLPSGMAEKRTLVQGVLPQRGLAFGGAEPKLYVVDHDRTLRVLDPLSGRLALVGPLRDDAGRAYLGDNLTWEPRADRLISLLADDRFAYETLALIDPASARVQPLTTFVDRFSVCSLARNPVAVPGPGGRDFAAGSLFFVDGRSAHLMAIELDPVAGRVDGLVDIGPVGPESSGSVCGSAFVSLAPLVPTPTPEPTATATETRTATLTATATRAATPIPSPPSATPNDPMTPTATASATPDGETGRCVCPRVLARVPAAVIHDAMANPASYKGWRVPLNPSLPPGPANPLRACLSMAHPNLDYHPLWNKPEWHVGCP